MPAFGYGVVDGRERERVAALHQVIGVHEHRAGPLDRGNEFRGADASVFVGVDQREGFRIELQAGDRARQRDP